MRTRHSVPPIVSALHPSRNFEGLSSRLVNYNHLRIDTYRIDDWSACVWVRYRELCFTRRMLEEILDVLEVLGDWQGREYIYLVWDSIHPDVHSWGGHLAYFVRCIRTANEASIRSYAYLALSCVIENFELPQSNRRVIPIAAVKGDAYGGGAEAAFSSIIIIAKRGARFRLPECLFGMVPGMGAITIGMRRVWNTVVMQAMVTLGRKCLAEELYDELVVDILVEPYQDLTEVVQRFLHGAMCEEEHQGNLACALLRRQSYNVNSAELWRETDRWVEIALSLPERHVTRMKSLATQQEARETSDSVAG